MKHKLVLVIVALLLLMVFYPLVIAQEEYPRLPEPLRRTPCVRVRIEVDFEEFEVRASSKENGTNIDSYLFQPLIEDQISSFSPKKFNLSDFEKDLVALSSSIEGVKNITIGSLFSFINACWVCIEYEDFILTDLQKKTLLDKVMAKISIFPYVRYVEYNRIVTIPENPPPIVPYDLNSLIVGFNNRMQ
jgi:hypothetical protein